MSNTKDRVLLRYAREGKGRWFLWFAMSAPTWENEDFPSIPDTFETADVWINVDNAKIQGVLNPPELEATIEGHDGR